MREQVAMVAAVIVIVAIFTALAWWMLHFPCPKPSSLLYSRLEWRPKSGIPRALETLTQLEHVQSVVIKDTEDSRSTTELFLFFLSSFSKQSPLPGKLGLRSGPKKSWDLETFDKWNSALIFRGIDLRTFELAQLVSHLPPNLTIWVRSSRLTREMRELTFASCPLISTWELCHTCVCVHTHK